MLISDFLVFPFILTGKEEIRENEVFNLHGGYLFFVFCTCKCYGSVLFFIQIIVSFVSNSLSH